MTERRYIELKKLGFSATYSKAMGYFGDPYPDPWDYEIFQPEEYNRPLTKAQKEWYIQQAGLPTGKSEHTS